MASWLLSPADSPQGCTHFNLSVESFHLSHFNDPTFDETFLLAHLRNLTCHDITLSNGHVSFFPILSEAHVRGKGNVYCQTQFDFAAYHGDLFATIDLAPSSVEVASELQTWSTTCAIPNKCLAATSTVAACSVAARVRDLHLEPPHKVLDWLLDELRKKIESDTEKYVCQVAAPQYASLLLNKTLEDPTPLPDVEPGAASLVSWPLTSALKKVLHAVGRVDREDVNVIQPSLVVLEESPTIRFHIETGRTPKSIDYLVNVNAVHPRGHADVSAGEGIINLVYDLVRSDHTSVNLDLRSTDFPGFVSHLSGAFHLQPHMTLSVDVSLPSLLCDDTSTKLYRCHIPRERGLVLSNLRLENFTTAESTDMEQVLTNLVAPEVLPALQSITDHLVSSWRAYDGVVTGSANLSDRVYIPMLREGVWRSTPPMWGMVIFCAAAAALFAGLTRLSAVRQAKSPVCWRRSGMEEISDPTEATRDLREEDAAPPTPDGSDSQRGAWEPLTLRRVLLEDTFLIAAVVLCTGCFAWSNCTTAANVVVGDRVQLYAFSLMKTAEDLWGSGLRFLSIAVFVFSCIYPYFKLASILVFTVVLQRPEAAVLRVIDYLGKFSFLDTFVVLIMVAGLTDGEVVSVRVHTSFYVFLAATIGSIAIGNYATTGWRRGTTLRRHPVGTKSTGGVSVAAVSGERERLLSSAGDVDAGGGSPSFFQRVGRSVCSFLRSIQWCISVPSCAVVLLCSVPAWREPCLRYRLGGLAPLVTQANRDVTLQDLGRANAACGWLLYVILLVAPCVHTLLYPRLQFLASWCAADVFLLACIAGLLQLNQFVQFVVGRGMRGVYAAHAVLLWPLLPLFAASLIQWFLTGAFILRVDLRGCVSKWFCCSRRDGNRRSAAEGEVRREESVAAHPLGLSALAPPGCSLGRTEDA